MSVRRLATEQPESFEFSDENMVWAETQIAKYPPDRKASAVIPLLWQAQKQHDGWLPEPAIRRVAEILGMAYIRVLEVATFYTMFNLEPVGRHFVQFCGTTPCWLRGADDLKEVCKRVIGPEKTVSEDGEFSWMEVECLGACANAPMVQINDDYYEDLDGPKLEEILTKLKNGEAVTPGSQTGRQTSAPEGGPTTLTTEGPYEGVAVAATAPAEEPEPEVVEPEPEPEETEAADADGSTEDQASATEAGTNEEPAIVTEDPDGEQPQGLTGARDGRPDDLKQISGVGPKIEGILHSLGIYHFDQIAAWSPANVEWVDDHLRFKGRIGRENWIEQARGLAAGDQSTGEHD